jgi:hypothetical protein
MHLKYGPTTIKLCNICYKVLYAILPNRLLIFQRFQHALGYAQNLLEVPSYLAV